MITEKEFNKIYWMYGLVPTYGLKQCFTFPGFKNFVWTRYSPAKKIAYCWNSGWYPYNGRPASTRNDTPYSNAEEFRREIDSMVKNFKAMNKKIRLRKIKEL